MVDNISPSPTSDSTSQVDAADHAFIMAINQSLDKSLDEIDEVNLQRLKNARVKALASQPQAARKWVPLSVAASVAVLLLIPLIMHHQSTNNTIEPEFEIVSQELPISAEEMDDIDMLMALEDGDA